MGRVAHLLGACLIGLTCCNGTSRGRLPGAAPARVVEDQAAPEQPAATSVQTKIVECAFDRIGIREDPKKNNAGKEVERMLAQVGFGPGYNWCAAEQYDIMVCADVDMPPPAKQYAWTPSWFIDKKVVWTQGNRSMQEVKVGDHVGIYFPSKKRIAHIGVIIRIEGRWLITQEGNTNAAGSRDGGGVEVHRRRIDTIYRIARWWE